MGEVWKDIIGYEGIYQISNLGQIRSKDRYARVCGGGRRLVKGKILKPCICSNGYMEAHLRLNGTRKVFLLHRLVAIHFIENPYDFPEVNHKDENIQNCGADNLEWCTSKYNANYGTRNQRMMLGRKFKPVLQFDKKGNFVKKWDKMADACRASGADVTSMIRVCKGKQKTCVGYIWKYAYREDTNNGKTNRRI